MSIQICLLKTGETIIADIKQAVDKETNKTLGYRVSNPFIVEFEYTNLTQVSDGEVKELVEKENDIKFKPWAPLARQPEFDFTEDLISVLYEPHGSIVDSYISILTHYAEKFSHKVEVNTSQTNISFGKDGNIAESLTTKNENIEGEQ
jgi:hypothetical protein